ncbi:MAG: hypothetical protein AB1831_01055 [Pseudomonadota bacterium]
MNRRTFLFLPLAALLPLQSGCETYPRYGEVRVHDRDYDVRVVFTDHDRVLIRDYYAPRHARLPPGLAKQGKVPPGHAWRMRRGTPIPQDYHWHAIPADLDGRLSRLPDGYVRVIVGADIGIMNVRTRVVVDLLEDIAD